MLKKILIFSVTLILTFPNHGFAKDTKKVFKNSTIRGRIIEIGCYVSSKTDLEYLKCRSKTEKAAAVMGLLEKGTGKIYVLLPKEGKHLPYQLFKDKGDINTIRGDEYDKGRSHFLKVRGFLAHWEP